MRIVQIICYLTYVYVIDIFCKKYLKITRKNENIFVSVLFGYRIVFNLLFHGLYSYWLIPTILFYAVNNILFIAIIILFFQGETEKKIFLASLLVAITTLIENFGVAFLSWFTLFYLHTIKGVGVPVLGEWESNLIFCISLGMVLLAVHLAAKYLTSLFYCKTKKWFILLAIPLFAVTTVLDIANWGASNGILVRSAGNMGLYYDQLFSYAEFCILTVLLAFAAGFYIVGMNKIYVEQQKSNQYHAQIIAYKMLEEQYHQSERLRHDLKNHVLALMGLLENQEWEKIKNYLDNMDSSVDLKGFDEATGNRVVDILMSQKRKKAEEKNFIWECNVQIPKMCTINEFDFCVLFGNILDNAMESCERVQANKLMNDCQPFINIQSRIVKKCFLLEVKNSADITKKHKIGWSSKKNAQKHGIGLLNIQDVVHKYNGTMNIEVQKGIFILSILIPLN